LGPELQAVCDGHGMFPSSVVGAGTARQCGLAVGAY